jgi:uncharacterized protein (TIGR03435 family)
MNALLLLFSHPWVERLGWTLVHFLWQGLAIAILYAVVRASPKAAVPHRRYLLACTALTAMLVAPIATYMLLHAPEPASPAVRHTPKAIPTSDSGVAFAMTAVETSPASAAAAAMPWLVMLWLTGALIFSIRLAAAWMGAARLRRRLARTAPAEWQQLLDRLRTRLGIVRPVRLLVSALAEVPIVVGWLRPVVLIPLGLLIGLPLEHLEALLLHELAHIRRHDYLVNVMQSVAEALLFYHPAVWWISGQIRAQRELCCDDLAVAATGDAFTYAIALADLEACRPVHAQTLLAANGAPLAGRIARLLGQTRPEPRTISTPAAASVVLATAAACVLFGQSADRPKFEVASIKPTAEQARTSAGMPPQPGGRLRANNFPARMLIMRAYRLQDFQIVGGPDWLRQDGFDIEAKGDSRADNTQLMLMLQSLLEERFQLKYHRETRELPVYALSVSRSGSKLPAPKEGGCVKPDDPSAAASLPRCGVVALTMIPSGISTHGSAVAMPEFIRHLSQMLGRPVLDRTGITNRFDVRLEYASDDSVAAYSSLWGSVQGHRESLAAAAVASNAAAAPNILTAIQEQLGLKLDSAKGPVEVMVIDHVEKPTGN